MEVRSIADNPAYFLVLILSKDANDRAQEFGTSRTSSSMKATKASPAISMPAFLWIAVPRGCLM
jgi:hypothetical protein